MVFGLKFVIVICEGYFLKFFWVDVIVGLMVVIVVLLFVMVLGIVSGVLFDKGLIIVVVVGFLILVFGGLCV